MPPRAAAASARSSLSFKRHEQDWQRCRTDQTHRLKGRAAHLGILVLERFFKRRQSGFGGRPDFPQTLNRCESKLLIAKRGLQIGNRHVSLRPQSSQRGYYLRSATRLSIVAKCVQQNLPPLRTGLANGDIDRRPNLRTGIAQCCCQCRQRCFRKRSHVLQGRAELKRTDGFGSLRDSPRAMRPERQSVVESWPSRYSRPNRREEQARRPGLPAPFFQVAPPAVVRTLISSSWRAAISSGTADSPFSINAETFFRRISRLGRNQPLTALRPEGMSSTAPIPTITTPPRGTKMRFFIVCNPAWRMAFIHA